MAAIDLGSLLGEIPGDDPAGPDLEYDAAYLAALRAAEGKPERSIGDTVVAAEEPDWREVRSLATDLLARSKDLRVAVLLARALLRERGLKGFRDGLALVQGLLETYWEGVHPQLDPDDDNDPTARVNTLTDLCDHTTLLEPLRQAPLVRSRAFGPVSYRDIEVAEGRASANPDAPALDAATVAGAFQDCALEDLAGASDAAASALTAARGIMDALTARIRTDQLPSLEPLTDLLSGIDRSLRARLEVRDPGRGGLAAGAAIDGTEPTEATAGATGATSGPPGQIASREDAIQALDRICDYYARREPSSPVPLLLKRARRLVNGTFVDIVRDLAPDAVSEIEKVCGLSGESE